MALQQVFGTLTAFSGWSTALASLTDGSASQSSAPASFTAPNLIIEAEITGATSANGTVDIYLTESADTGTDFATTETANMRFVGSITVPSNSSYRKIFHVKGIAEDLKCVVVNNTGQTLAAGTISYQTVTINDV